MALAYDELILIRAAFAALALLPAAFTTVVAVVISWRYLIYKYYKLNSLFTFILLLIDSKIQIYLLLHLAYFEL